MLKKIPSLPFVLLFMAFFFLSVPIAQSASIKDRMAARIPAINSLKDQGVVGENNSGFLEFRGSGQPQKDVIDAENRDRQKAYELIGKSQGAPAQLVGQRRAKTIAKRGKSGQIFQKSDGSWYKK